MQRFERRESETGNSFLRNFFIYLHVKSVGKGRKNKVMLCNKICTDVVFFFFFLKWHTVSQGFGVAFSHPRFLRFSVLCMVISSMRYHWRNAPGCFSSSRCRAPWQQLLAASHLTMPHRTCMWTSADPQATLGEMQRQWAQQRCRRKRLEPSSPHSSPRVANILPIFSPTWFVGGSVRQAS